MSPNLNLPTSAGGIIIVREIMTRFRVPKQNLCLITGIEQSHDGGTIFTYDKNNQAAVNTILMNMCGSLEQAEGLPLSPEVTIRLRQEYHVSQAN